MHDHLVELDVIRGAVQLACRAPSLHNSQPWRWVLDRWGLRLYLDRGRIIRATDRSGREANISCGAVLDHLRVAMLAAGWVSHIERFPNPDDPDHLASVRFSRLARLGDRSADEFLAAYRRRADVILLRHTDRRPFGAPPDPVGVHQLLAAAAADTADTADTEVHLDVIAPEDRPRLVEASRIAESQRAADTPYFLELSWWTVGYDLTEGIPHGVLESAEPQRVDVGRVFVAGSGQHRPDPSDNPEDHSMIVVLSTNEDTPPAALRCGEALSAVLLEATMAGLGTCPLTHVTELPAGREIVAELIGRTAAIPQVLIRVGQVPPLREAPTPTPRRPLDEVLQIDPTPGSAPSRQG